MGLGIYDLRTEAGLKAITFLRNSIYSESKPHQSPIFTIGVRYKRASVRGSNSGRFAITWSSVQEDFLATRATNAGTGKHRKQTGQQWQHRLILEIWKQWIELWKLRNERVHGNNQMTQRAASRRSAENELVALYDVREQMDPEIATALMFNKAQDHLQQQHRNTRNWLHTNAPILRDSLRRAKRRALAGVRSIRSYFGLVR